MFEAGFVAQKAEQSQKPKRIFPFVILAIDLIVYMYLNNYKVLTQKQNLKKRREKTIKLKPRKKKQVISFFMRQATNKTKSQNSLEA